MKNTEKESLNIKKIKTPDFIIGAKYFCLFTGIELEIICIRNNIVYLANFDVYENTLKSIAGSVDIKTFNSFYGKTRQDYCNAKINRLYYEISKLKEELELIK